MKRLLRPSKPSPAAMETRGIRLVLSSCQHPFRRQGSLRDAATVADGFAVASCHSAPPPGSVSSLGHRPPLDPGGVPAGSPI